MKDSQYYGLTFQIWLGVFICAHGRWAFVALCLAMSNLLGLMLATYREDKVQQAKEKIIEAKGNWPLIN